MSTRSKDDDSVTQYRKPRADLYTVLLILALIAILVAIVCLWAEMGGVYEYKIKGRTSALARPAAAATVAKSCSPLGNPWATGDNGSVWHVQGRG